LNLPPGKAACKAGQAMIGAFNKASPEQQKLYLSDGEGTQIILTCADQDELLHINRALTGSGFQTTIVIERGTLIGIGIGPVHRELLRPLLGNLPCMK
jgi:peptidyl-tRNA hydrolase